MINQSGGKILKIEIHHFVRSNNHGTLLAVKCFHNPADNIIVNIKVIAVELDGEFPAFLMKYTFIPAASDTQIVTLRDNMDDSFV